MLLELPTGALADALGRRRVLLGAIGAEAAAVALLIRPTRRPGPDRGRIGLTTGPIGLLAAYLATMAVHGAANPVHQGVLHRAAVGPSTRATRRVREQLDRTHRRRAGGIALGALADAAGLTTATLVGAAVLAIADPLHLVAGRAVPALERHTRRT